jgi:hypothetical protein
MDHCREKNSCNNKPDRHTRGDEQPTAGGGLKSEDCARYKDRKDNERDREIDPHCDSPNAGVNVTLKTPPHECFDELVKAEQEWQRAQRRVLRAPIPVNQHVDADPTDDDSTHEIGLWGKTHSTTLATLLRDESRYVRLTCNLVAQFQAAIL